MLRAIVTGLALGLSALCLGPETAGAAGPGARSAAGPGHHGVTSARPATRGVVTRHAYRPAHREGRHHGRFHGGGPVYGYDPGFARPLTAVSEIEVERSKPVDPFAFENLPVRAGIPYPPIPEPTIYRLEGRRDKPTIRAIRIADAQGAGRATRDVHAETGALLLTVPGR